MPASIELRVRVLCSKCKEAWSPSDVDLARVGVDRDTDDAAHREALDEHDREDTIHHRPGQQFHADLCIANVEPEERMDQPLEHPRRDPAVPGVSDP